MITITVASIIVAVISLVGAVAAAALAAYTTCWSDRRKRHSEAAIILNKYQDPLLLAAASLRHKIRGILAVTGSSSLYGDADYNVVNTAFLIGQFFAWVHILRLESQFLSIQRTHKTRHLTDAFFDIEEAWSRDSKGHSFALWRGQQSAIGELLTVIEDGQRSCMGYAAFHQRWHRDRDFRRWFGDFGGSRGSASRDARDRLGNVGVGLTNLMNELDPERLLMAAYSRIDVEQNYESEASSYSHGDAGTYVWPFPVFSDGQQDRRKWNY